MCPDGAVVLARGRNLVVCEEPCSVAKAPRGRRGGSVTQKSAPEFRITAVREEKAWKKARDTGRLTGKGRGRVGVCVLY